jgi:hypothetical protein
MQLARRLILTQPSVVVRVVDGLSFDQHYLTNIRKFNRQTHRLIYTKDMDDLPDSISIMHAALDRQWPSNMDVLGYR